jgi:predicted transposase/invertase (TIGR01784 family)
MNRLLSPKIDFVFRVLFTRDVEILKDLLSNVLGVKGDDRIASVEVKNSEILPFPSSNPDDFHYRFAFRDGRRPELELNDDLSLHVFDLPAIERIAVEKQNDDLVEWLRFFNRAHDEGEDGMREKYQNPMIHRAYEGLKALSADEKTRELAERREKALKDEVSFLNEARRKGWRDTALRLLKMNLLTVDQIAEATGLDVHEVERLKRSGNFGNA